LRSLESEATEPESEIQRIRTPSPEIEAVTPKWTPAQEAPPAGARRIQENNLEAYEYASPAFIKRARVSYGSLFEGGFDTLEEDGGIQGRGRKRTRFGRDSSAWRLVSRSPSLEPPVPEQEEASNESVMAGDAATTAPQDESHAPSEPAQQLGARVLQADPQSQSQVEVEPSAEQSQSSMDTAMLPKEAVDDIQSETRESAQLRIDLIGADIDPELGTGLDQSNLDGYVELPTPTTAFTSIQSQFAFGSYQRSTEVLNHNYQSGEETRLTAEAAAAGGPLLFNAPGAAPMRDEDATALPAGYAEHPSTLMSISDISESGTGREHYPLSENPQVESEMQYSYNEPHGRGIYNGGPDDHPMMWTDNSIPAAYPPLGDADDIDVVDVEAYPNVSYPPLESTIPAAIPPDREDGQPEKLGFQEQNNPQAHFSGDTYRIGVLPDGSTVQFPPASGDDDSGEADGEADDDDDGVQPVDEGEGEDAEHDGGDYDMTNYADVADDEDDAGAEDEVSVDENDPDAQVYDPDDEEADGEEEDEEDEGQEEDEDEDEDEDGEGESGEEEYDEDEESEEESYSQNVMERQAAPKTVQSGPPVVISLLSDSEDDEPATPQPPPINGPPRSSRQTVEEEEDGSASEAGAGEELDSQEDEDDEGDGERDEEEEDEDEEEEEEEDEGEDEDEPVDPASILPNYEVDEEDLSTREMEAENINNSDQPVAVSKETGINVDKTHIEVAASENEKVQSIAPPPSLGLDRDPLAALEQQLQAASEEYAAELKKTEAVSSNTRMEVDEETTIRGGIVHEEVEDDGPDRQLQDEVKLVEHADAMDIDSEEKVTDVPNEAAQPSNNAPSEKDISNEEEAIAAGENESAKRGLPAQAVIQDSDQLLQAAILSAEHEIIEEEQITTEEDKMPEESQEGMRGINPFTPPLTQQSQSQLGIGETVPERGQLPEENVPLNETNVLATPQDTQQPETAPSQPVEDLSRQTTRDGIVRESEERHLPAPSELATTPSQTWDQSSQPTDPRSPSIGEFGSQDTPGGKSRPRRGRGHRRDVSFELRDDDSQEHSSQASKPSLATRRSTRRLDHAQAVAENVRVTRARSHSFQRSDTPNLEEETGNSQSAEMALVSPSVGSVAGEERVATVGLKSQLSKSLRLDVPELIGLKQLRSNLGKVLDIMGIATTQPPTPKRAKGGPRGIMMEFNITDHSTAPTQVISVHIFRAHKAALPVVQPGDAVLLRAFSVVAMKDRGFGLRAGDPSSWAIFEGSRDDDLPQIRGPPVEVTNAEVNYAGLLKKWYNSLDEKSLAKLDKANQKATEAGREER
jgi:hypothetical protein